MPALNDLAAAHSGAVVTIGGPTADAALLGGKGAHLAEMTRAGLPVPPAFCLTTELFRAFLEETGLADEVEGAEPDAVRKEILDHEIPAPIARAILAAYDALGRPRVAVRSSGSQEDGAAHSFAGQHDTLLDVEGEAALLDAVKTCWASLWSDRAAVYRQGSGPVGLIAVVVQEMVDSDASGVLFTADPISGESGRLVVEACWGLGEGLVAGKVTSDSFVVDSRGLEVVERRVRYKVTRCVPVEPGRIDLVKVDPELRNTPCLTDRQLTELGALAVRVRDHYGAEQDIEWALKDGRLHLLQTRPITVRPGRAADSPSPYGTPQPPDVQHRTLWSRMDIGEIFVGMMSPLGLSFARYYQHHVHGDCARALGVRDVGDMDLHMGYFQGHVYLNISYTAHVLAQCPPTRDQRPFTERFASEEVDLSTYRNPFGPYPGGIKGTLAAGSWAKYATTELRGAKRRAERMGRARLYEFDRARGIDLGALDRSELHAELDRRLAFLHDMHVGYMPYYINAFGFYDVLTMLCSTWLGDDGTNLQNRIKSDMSGLRTVASARELWNLAQAAKERPEVMRIIRGTRPADIPVRLRADEAGRSFWDGHVEPFLRANGTRGSQEMELTNPRWIDDPSYIFQLIRRYADEEYTLDSGAGHGRSGERESEELLRRLPAGRRKVLRTVMSLYATCSELRESTRMAMVTSVWLVRGVVYEVARRLTEAGVLYSPDEVAYLDFEEVRRYLAGDEPAPAAFPRQRIDERRRAHEYRSRLPEPPLTFIGEYDATTGVRAVADGARLEGLGSSPGRVVGRARVIEDLTWQADEFRAGEILVARFTDASWTPLFAIAGGVVTDIGSMLSHSSIVAREFGVPSVVNTKHATRHISTGDLIVVDGDTGTVEVVEE
ncbi:PEP/pyruvate-binding domain-containing protein [Streptomyces violascens]|uniref:PEP/pyruvate-binding domain-containing protein n=1 Tax=Streptomyces violascens TaxID=67381 RepID=UPI0037B1CCC5